MQKFLRMLTLMALLLVPWVTQAQTPLFSEDFEGGSMPTGWTTDGPGTWTVATGDYSSTTGAGQGTYNAKITHGTTGNQTKLITPAIDFTGVSSAVLSYMHIERSWAGDIDELRVYYRNDTTGTWTLLSGQEFTAAFSTWTTESDIILPNLSNTYQIAFEFTDRYGYGLGIDYVVIEQGSSCTRPTGLAATLTPGNGTVATLNWTAGGTESAWVLEYGTASDFSNVTSVNVTATPTAGPSYSLTGLTAESTYYARVKAVCSATEQSGWCNTICTFTPTNAYSVTVNDGTATNGYVPIYGYYCDDNIKSTFIIPAADLAAMQYGTITKLTFYASNASVSWGNAQFTVYMSETTDNTVSGIADFTTMTQVMTAASLGINDNIMEVTLTTPYQYMGGNLMIAFDQPTSGSYSSCNWYGVSANGASYGGYGSSVSQQNFLPKTRFDYIPGQAPACPTPTQLAVNYTGGNSSQVSWDSTATLWNIKVNGVVTNNVTANPYTLTGLNFGTTYTIQVQANCDGDTSEWSTPVSFTTDLCDTINQCTLTITLTDAYGDGGGQIQVVDSVTNTVLGTYTNSGSSTTYTLNVCNGRTLNFVFASTDSWSYENGWVITDINEEVVSSHEGCTSSGACDAPTNGVVATYTVNCAVTTCRRPTAVAATEIGPRSVQLGWTENGEATSWVVAYAPAGDTVFTEVAAATNPYTLTGLTPETAYTVKVRPVCSDQFIRWSDPISFTTDVACPAPTSLAVTPGTTVADVNWNGNANNYTLQYTQVPTGTVSTVDSIVLSYDDGSYVSGIGNSTAANWTWGVMYPASMYMGGNLTKVSVFETSSFNDTTYTVKIYSGGTTAPDSLLASQVVTPMGSDGFHEITLTTPVTIDFGQNLWIVVEAYGTYVMSSCNSTNPNNTWVYENGSWSHLADLVSSLAGRGWMIRGQINPFDLDAITWTTVNNATAPASLTGLTAETDYITRVKALCGGQDGESAWEASLFTTLEVNPIPMDVVVTPAATRAAISWRGYSDSYKVYYRTAEVENVVFSEGFESDIDTTLWKIYTVGEAPQTNGWYTYNPESGLSFSAHGGSMVASAWSWSNSAYNADNWLVTPQVTLGGTLKYWERTAANWPDHYEVIVSTTGNTVADFANGTVIRARAIAATTGDWNEVTLDLSAFSGQAGYIAFHHADTDANYLVIDDIRVIGSITPAGAWVEVPTTATNVTLTGLTPETTYEYRITGIVNNVENAGTAIAQFTTDTQAFCPAPVITVGEFQNRTASFSWTCPGDSVFVTLYNHNGQQVWGQFFGPNDTAVNNMYFPEAQYPFGYVYIYAVGICGDIADSNLSWAYDGFAVTCDTTDQCTVSYVLHGQNGWQGGVLDVFDTVSGVIVSSLTLPADLDTHTTTYQLCTDRVYRVAFRDGTGAGQSSFSNVAFEIVGPNGNTYFSATAPDTGTLGYFTHSCSTVPVVDIATLPYFCDFEAEGNNGWNLINGTTNSWYVDSAINNGGSRSLYISNDEGATNAYTNSTTSWVFATRTLAVAEPGNYIFSFDWKANGESTWDYLRAFLAPAGTDTTLVADVALNGATSTSAFNNVTPAGWIDLNPAGGKLNLSTTWNNCYSEQNLAAGNYDLIFLWVNDGGGGTQPPAAIDNVVVRANTCPAVQNVVANPTDNSITLTWTPAGNENAWEVSCGNTVQTVTTASYTFTGLTANTEYTVGVRALCTETESSMTATQTVRTACGLLSLPYTTGFEDNELQGTTNLLRLPWCSYRYYVLGTSSTYNYYPYSYSSSTYAHTGSRSLYFYGATSTSYPDSMTFILPAVDVQNNPMNGNRLRFYARSSSASYNKVVYVGTLTDPTNMSTYSPVGQVTVTGTTHTLYEVPLTNASATAPYVCLTVLRGSGSLYLDDLTLEEMPSCMDVSNLAVSAVTNNSITLTWADTQNPSATYTVIDATGVIATGITGMTYTVTGLNANTEYTFNVVANCTADNASPAASVTGRTACAAYDAPYTWTFEDMTANAAPLCWTKVGTGTTNVLSSTANAHNSTMYLRFSGATSNLILLPETEDEINTLQVRFWTRPENFSNASCGTFSVGYVTDASDATTFVALATYTYNEFSAYDEKTVIFSGAPTGARMAMRHNPTSTSWYWYVDDVTIEDLPNCVSVTALTATPTNNSVTLTWTDASNTGATYTVSDGSSVIATGITSTTYTVTGLTSLTDYTFYVTANCSADVASTAVSVAVRTLCDAVSVPFVENFDTYTTSTTVATGVQVPCWTLAHQDVTMTDAQKPQIYYSSSNAHSGSYSLRLYYRGIYAMPEISANINQLQMNFWVKQTSASYNVVVGVMSDLNDATTFVPIDTIDNGSNTSTMQQHTVNFSSYTGNGHYIAFRNIHTSYNYSYNYIDDVTVEEIPSCEAPSITDVTYAPYNNGEGDYTATVTWNSTGAQSYEFQWIEPSLTRVINNGNDTVHAFVIHPDEASYVKVRAICGAGDTSAWSDSVRLYYGYCEPTPTSVDNNGVTSVAFGGMANTTSHAGNTAAYVNNRAMVGTVPAGTTATVDITYATGYDYGTIIWVDWNKNYTFDGNEVVAVGTSASTNPTTLTLSFMIPATQDTGDYVMRIVGADSYFNIYVDSIAAAATANPCFTASYSVAEDYTLHVSPAAAILDSTVYVVSVNDTTMGTVLPNVGTMVYHWGDNVSFTAVPNTGYNFAYWLLANGNTAGDTLTQNPVSGTIDSTDANQTYYLTAVFVPQPDSLTLVLAVNDATMGSTTPAPGTYRYGEGDVMTATATPVAGYVFDYWVVNIAGLGTDTVYTASITDTVLPTYVTLTINATAHFSVCPAVAFPFSENFEGGVMPACWSTDGPGNWTVGTGDYSTATGAHSGTYNAKISANGSYVSTKLITPAIDMTGITNAELRFWHVQRAWSGDQDELTVYYRTSTTGTWQTLATYTNEVSTWTEEVIPLTVAGGILQVAFEMYDGYGYGVAIDDITITLPPACAAVTGLTASNVTNNSVTLTWNDNQNTGATYTVYNGQTVVATGINDTTYTVTGLTGRTAYTFGVVANCSADLASTMTTLNVTTAPDPIMCGNDMALVFTNADSITGNTNYCPGYSLYNYSYSEVIVPATAIEGLGEIKGLEYYVNTLASGSTYFNNCEIYLMNTTATSLANGFIQDANNFQLVYNGDLNNTETGWRLVTFDTSFTYDGVSNLLVAVRRGHGDWASSGSFGAYTASTQLARYVYNDNNAYTIGSITGGTATTMVPVYHLIGCQGVAPECSAIRNLTASNVTFTSVTLTWADTVNTGATYTVYSDSTVVATGVTGTTYTVTGLTANTNYTFSVVANCSATAESLPISISVYTGYCTPTPTSVDGSGITSVSFGGMTNTTSHAGNTAAFVDNTSLSGSVPAGTTATVDITYATGWTYGTIIWVDWNNNLSFDGNEVVAVGTSTSDNPTTLTLTFDIPATQALGSYRMRIVGADSYFDNYTGSIAAAAGANPCGSYSYGVAEDYTLNVITAPNCLAVTGLTVSNITTTGATLTWADSLNTGATYTVYNMTDTSVVATGITATTYTFTNLMDNTAYNFGVVANCSANDASLFTTASFRTPCNSLNVPFVEAFDASSNTIDCWTLYANEANPIIITNNMLRFSSYSTASDYNQYAYSPVLNTPTTGDSLHVRVRYATYGSNDSLWFGYRTASTTTYTWTPISFQTNGQNDMQYLEANVPINAVQFGIHYYGNYSYYAWIDSVEVTTWSATAVPDSATVIVSNNDTTLGMITPLPGTYRVAVGDSIVLTAFPNGNNSFNGWLMTLDGDTMMTMPMNPFTVPVTVNLANRTIGLQAQFAAPGAAPDSVTFVVATADATMGTTTPAPGTHRVAVGDSIIMVAQPNPGYHNLYWVESMSVAGYTFYDTLAYDTILRIGSQMAAGATFYMTAYFEADAGCQTTYGFDTVVACDSTVWNGNTYTQGGTYSATLTNAAGCDSIVTLSLTINNSTTGAETISACDSYTLNGITYTATTTVVDTLTTAAGCDSVVTITLTVNHSTTHTDTVTSCDSYVWHGVTYTASSTVVDTLVNAAGCDSICTLVLTINNSVTTTETVTMCDSYTWNGVTYTASTVDTVVFAALNGCDSTVVLNLTINYSTETIDSVDAVDSYTWRGNTYYVTTVAHDTLPAANGCDSVLTLVLNMTYSASIIDTVVACDSATWHGRTYYASTVDYDTVSADSIYMLLLTVNYSQYDTVAVTARGQYVWHDSIYTVSGTYNYYDQTDEGCDWVETLILTIDSTADQWYSVAVVVANTEGQIGVGGSYTGAGSYLAGTEVTLTATPDSGYLFDGWYTRSGIGFGGELITSDSVYTFTLDSNVVVVAMFERIGSNSALLTVAVDSTMGYVLFNGERALFNVYRGTLGETVTLEAVGQESNCVFVGWVNAQGDTLSRDAVYDYVLEATTTTLTAAFVRNEGIADVDAASVTIFGRENGVVVRGAAQAEVYVFDVVGRMVGHVSAAADEEFIRLSQTGVYLVKVGTLPARRVVVRQ